MNRSECRGNSRRSAVTVASRRMVLAVALGFGSGAAVAAQAPIPAPAPGSPHSGGFTPFRDRGFAGTAMESTTLEQPDSPLRLGIYRTERDERGLTLSLRLENLTEGPSSRQVLGAWVLAPDGTVRGYQRYEGTRAIAAGATRTIEFTVRHSTTSIAPGDVTVVAVQESAGALAWRQDKASLQKAIQAAVLR